MAASNSGGMQLSVTSESSANPGNRIPPRQGSSRALTAQSRLLREFSGHSVSSLAASLSSSSSSSSSSSFLSGPGDVHFSSASSFAELARNSGSPSSPATFSALAAASSSSLSSFLLPSSSSSFRSLGNEESKSSLPTVSYLGLSSPSSPSSSSSSSSSHSFSSSSSSFSSSSSSSSSSTLPARSFSSLATSFSSVSSFASLSSSSSISPPSSSSALPLSTAPQNFVLSRLEITGAPDENTPLCVLEEIFASLRIFGVKMDAPESVKLALAELTKVVPDVIENGVRKTPSEHSQREVQCIATFLNPSHSVKWKRTTLFQAFQFLWQFTYQNRLHSSEELKICQKLLPNFTFGLQTGETPFALNNCVLYRICRRSGLNFARTTTTQQLIQGFLALVQPKMTILAEITRRLDSLSSNELAQHFLEQKSFGAELREKEIILAPRKLQQIIHRMRHSSLEELQQAQKDITFLDPLRSRATPQNFADAVTLAALHYNYDLTLADDPVKAYLFMQKSPAFQRFARNKKQGATFFVGTMVMSSAPEIPVEEIPVCSVDASLLGIHNYNPRLLLFLERFNPHFDLLFYTGKGSSESLLALARREGVILQPQEIREFIAVANRAGLHGQKIYDLLAERYYLNTFHAGKQFEAWNQKLFPSQDDLESVAHPDEILCFGVHGGVMYATTYAGLEEYFSQSENFRNPFITKTIESFSEEQLSKLELLCVRQSENVLVNQNREKLVGTIGRVKCLTGAANAQVIELVRMYKKNDLRLIDPSHDRGKDVKTLVKELLGLLLEAGLMMRGWKGKGTNFPIEAAMVPADELKEVERRSLVSVNCFIERCQRQPKIGQVIGNLPMVLYMSGGGYIVTKDPNVGRTVLERLNIILERPRYINDDGELVENDNSCIRLSSNWIVSTAQRYLTILGIPVPFSIHGLKEIS